jgi:hypothetical protein
MLSDHEQRIWNDIQRFYDVEQPDWTGRGSPAWDAAGLEDMPAAVVAGCWITIMLVLFGAVLAGLAVGGATALGWLLWRSWPQLTGADPTAASSGRGAAGATGGGTRTSADATRSRPDQARRTPADSGADAKNGTATDRPQGRRKEGRR